LDGLDTEGHAIPFGGDTGQRDADRTLVGAVHCTGKCAGVVLGDIENKGQGNSISDLKFSTPTAD
jgi:hypothetical protein